MKVAVLSRDLMLASRILGQASAASHESELVADPSALPPAETVDVLFVNWADRDASWADALVGWRDRIPRQDRPRLILYGPHTDLDAHAAARSAGLGPMVARSKLMADLPRLIVVAEASPSTVDIELGRR